MEDIDLLPFDFRIKISKLNYSIQKILQINIKKHSYVFLAQRNGAKFIIKHNASTGIDRNGIYESEIYFYNKFKNNSLVPKLVYCDKQTLITCYFEGMSLYSYLKNNEIENVLVLFNKLYFSVKKIETVGTIEFAKKELFYKVKSRFKDLVISGPINTSVTKLQRRIAKFVFMLAVPKLYISTYLYTNVNIKKTAFAHNDLHANNILLNSDFDFKIIDFEDATTSGFWIIDLFYLQCIIESRLDIKYKNEARKLFLETFGVEDDYSLRLLNSLSYAISINLRYYDKIFLKNICNYMVFCMKLF